MRTPFIGTLYGSGGRAAVTGWVDAVGDEQWQGEVHVPHEALPWMVIEREFVLRVMDGSEGRIRVRTCDVSGGRIAFRGDGALALRDDITPMLVTPAAAAG